MVKSKTLRHIVIINFEENVFDDALTTASILLCANDDKSNKVQFSNVVNLNDFTNVRDIIKSYPYYLTEEQVVEFENLNPNIKWRSYYQKQNSIKYKHLVPFINYGKVVRGIATGSNDYFTFSPSKARIFGITKKYLLPCICRAIDSKNLFSQKKILKNWRQTINQFFL